MHSTASVRPQTTLTRRPTPPTIRQGPPVAVQVTGSVRESDLSVDFRQQDVRNNGENRPRLTDDVYGDGTKHAWSRDELSIRLCELYRENFGKMARVVGARFTAVEAQFDANVRPARTWRLLLFSFTFSCLATSHGCRARCCGNAGAPVFLGPCSPEQFECS